MYSSDCTSVGLFEIWKFCLEYEKKYRNGTLFCTELYYGRECILYGVLCVLSFMEIVFVCQAVLQKYNSPQLLLKDDI